MVEIIVVSVSIVITILYALFVDKNPPGWDKKEFVKFLLVVEFLALFVGIAETYLLAKDPRILDKPEAGKSSALEERRLSVEDFLDEEVSIEVLARSLSDAEIKAAFEKAKREIEESFAGENESLDRIENPVVMKGSYADGLVLAEWRLDDYSLIYTDGTLKNEDLTEPFLNTARVFLTCQGETEIYEFSFSIIPVSRSGNDLFLYELKQYISKDMKSDPYNKSASLPSTFQSYSLIWKEKAAMRGICIFLMGIIVLIGLGIGRVEEEKKKNELRKEELKLGYSDMLSTLTLLLGSGMSVRKAWEKMVNTNKDRAGPKNAIYEEMEITLNQIKTGVSEITALEEFGVRTKLSCYKKLSGLLIGYIQKGSRDITNKLNNEVTIAFEERKALAKVAGELAGTKLLLPMIMLLGITLIIIIVPALLSFSF